MKKILIIDDDPDILEALKLVLTMDGFDTASTNKGDETFSKVLAYKPDLIVLDLFLSGNDGRVICKHLKSDKRTLGIPVILISAHSNAKKIFRECGADYFLAKPFSAKNLINHVNKFTQQRN